jgi:uncharacterized protein YjaZ
MPRRIKRGKPSSTSETTQTQLSTSSIRAEIEAAIADLRQEIASNNVEKIKVKLEAAHKAVLKIGQHMSGGGSGGSQSGSGP